MYFEEIMKAAACFKAKFITVNSIDDASDIINKPHEDYPLRVNKTLELICTLIGDKDNFRIDKQLIQYLHYELFTGELADPMVTPGFYRTHSVGFIESEYVPPDAMHIEYLLGHLFAQADKMTPAQFYRHFQCIHPFSDGNGRVGGIILTVMSYFQSEGKEILAPLQ